MAADPDEQERRRADLIARILANSKPMTPEVRKQVVTLLAKPRGQGAA